MIILLNRYTKHILVPLEREFAHLDPELAEKGGEEAGNRTLLAGRHQNKRALPNLCIQLSFSK